MTSNLRFLLSIRKSSQSTIPKVNPCGPSCHDLCWYTLKQNIDTLSVSMQTWFPLLNLKQQLRMFWGPCLASCHFSRRYAELIRLCIPYNQVASLNMVADCQPCPPASRNFILRLFRRPTHTLETCWKSVSRYETTTQNSLRMLKHSHSSHEVHSRTRNAACNIMLQRT